MCSVSVRYDFPQFVPVIRKQFYYRENNVTIRADLALVVYQPPKNNKLINSAIDYHTGKKKEFFNTFKTSLLHSAIKDNWKVFCRLDNILFPMSSLNHFWHPRVCSYINLLIFNNHLATKNFSLIISGKFSANCIALKNAQSSLVTKSTP